MIEYRIAYTKSLSRIRKLEKEKVKFVNNIDSSTIIQDLLERSNIFKKQEDYAAVFAVVTKKGYMGLITLQRYKSHFLDY